MDVNWSAVFISIGLVCLLNWSWRLLTWVWLKPKRLERCLRSQGFKGNSYKLLFGDTKEIIAMMRQARSKPMNIFDGKDDILPRVLPLHQHNVDLHGKNYFEWLGPTPRITITDPKLIKEIMLNHMVFRRPATNPLVDFLVCGVLTYEAEKWAKHRSLLNPAFHLDKLKKMVPAMYLSCSEMSKRWEALVSTEGKSEVDVWPHLSNLTGDMISRTLFGSNYEEGKGIFELQRTQCEIVLQCLQSPYIPGWRFLPTPKNKKMKAIYDEVKTILTKIINKRKQTAEREDGGNDLLGILLKTTLMEGQENGKKKTVALTTNEVIEECKLFYLAGQDTTVALLAWTMVLLSKYQNWQALARDEVKAVFGDREPDFDGLNHLRTINMILYEVLRLYSPSVNLPKTVHQDTMLGELHLLQGTEICMPTLAIHRDPELWGEDALDFNPLRFSEGVSKATKGHTIFFPFGGGPRICMGQNFAMLEAKVLLATILRKFQFQLSPTYVHAPCVELTVQPQHGVSLILQKI